MRNIQKWDKTCNWWKLLIERKIADRCRYFHLCNNVTTSFKAVSVGKVFPHNSSVLMSCSADASFWPKRKYVAFQLQQLKCYTSLESVPHFKREMFTLSLHTVYMTVAIWCNKSVSLTLYLKKASQSAV